MDKEIKENRQLEKTSNTPSDKLDKLTNDGILQAIKIASNQYKKYSWHIGNLLLIVDDAIFNKHKEFENYNSFAQWLSENEGDLPFKRSSAKGYMAIAFYCTLEDFMVLTYRQINAILVTIKDEEDIQKAIRKAVDKEQTFKQTKTMCDDYSKKHLPVPDAIKPPPATGKGNMYELAEMTWNPFRGCGYKCSYCKDSSFQSFSDRNLYQCEKCNDYTNPHLHPERLYPKSKEHPDGVKIDHTPYMTFIFCCSSADISFCETDDLQLIINRIIFEWDKNFLIQSKNPKTFNRVTFPDNVILGTTIETNRDKEYKANKISNAPLPSKRIKDFYDIIHPHKMLTLEPLLKFDLEIMLSWIDEIKPSFIWIGTDSADSDLAKRKLEPTKAEIMELYQRLGEKGFVVMLKEKLINRIKDGTI